MARLFVNYLCKWIITTVEMVSGCKEIKTMRALKYSAVLFVLGLWASVANGMFAWPQYFPVERLIDNATAYIQQDPNDANGYYILGSIKQHRYIE